MRHNKNDTTNGFTLIELLLAMAFLASILIFASMTIIQTLGVYNKGIAFKQINQAGRQLTSDMSQIASSGYGTATSDKSDKAGFVCISDGSGLKRGYLWDAPGVSAGQNIYKTPDGKPISIIRTNPGIDADALGLCQLPTGDTVVQPNVMTPISSDQLAIIDSSVITPDTSLNPGLTRLTFVLGTVNTDGTLNPTKLDGIWQCAGGSLGNFCAVGTFEVTLYSPNVL